MYKLTCWMVVSSNYIWCSFPVSDHYELLKMTFGFEEVSWCQLRVALGDSLLEGMASQWSNWRALLTLVKCVCQQLFIDIHDSSTKGGVSTSYASIRINVIQCTCIYRCSTTQNKIDNNKKQTTKTTTTTTKTRCFDLALGTYWSWQQILC